MDREFDIGDRVICNESGVVGKVIKFYTPTSCEEQTMVLCDDRRRYHAPTSTWRKYGKGQGVALIPIVDFNKCEVNFVSSTQHDKEIYDNMQLEIYRSLMAPSNLIRGGVMGRFVK